MFKKHLRLIVALGNITATITNTGTRNDLASNMDGPKRPALAMTTPAEK